MRKRAVFRRIGRQFVEDERQRRRRFLSDRATAPGDGNPVSIDPAIGRQQLGDETVQRAFGPSGMGANEIMRLAQSADRVRQFLDKVFGAWMLAALQRYQPADYGEDVLDPVRKFTRQQIPRIGYALEIVDIDCGAEPGLGILVTDDEGPGAQNHPAIDPVLALHPRLGFPPFLVSARSRAGGPQLLEIVGMHQRGEIEIRKILRPEKFVQRGIGILDIAIRIRGPGIDREVLGELAGAQFADFEPVFRIGGIALRRQATHYRAAEDFQPFALQSVQAFGPRFVVDHAQRTQRDALARNQGLAGIEANAVVGLHQLHLSEARILARIGHHQWPLAFHRMRAQAGGARRFLFREPLARHETLAILFDQSDHRHRNFAQTRCEFDDLHQFAIVLYGIRAIGCDHAAAQPLLVRGGIGCLMGRPEGKTAELHLG